MSSPRKPLKIAFLGTPEFSVPAFNELIKSENDVCAVYTQPPRPAGRGKIIRKSPIHDLADINNITVRTPLTLNDKSEIEAFCDFCFDIAVVVAYGLILPPKILEAPRLGCINIHASLLPRWRGAAPIQRAIMAGDDHTGVSIMQMEEGLDTGPILVSKKISISKHLTSRDLHEILARTGAYLINSAISGLAQGSLTATPQSETDITYANKISRADGRLIWPRPAVELERLIRALDPWPGAWCTLKGQRLKVLRAKVVDTITADNINGMIIDKNLTVACGRGGLRLTCVQKPGKEPMHVESFLRGTPVPIGTILS